MHRIQSRIRNRVIDSERRLEIYKLSPSKFLNRFLTIDETRINQYTTEANSQPAEWLKSVGSQYFLVCAWNNLHRLA